MEGWSGRGDECRSDSGNGRWTDWRKSRRDEELMADKMERMFQRVSKHAGAIYISSLCSDDHEKQKDALHILLHVLLTPPAHS